MAPTATSFMSSFLQPNSDIRPGLLELTDKQEDKVLNIDLCIGIPGESQIAITGFSVELHHDNANYKHVDLPGADGPNNHLSTGHRSIDVVSEGHFVSIQGMEYVETKQGCWEICWMKDKPAGNLVFGFEVPHEYKRNAATLPACEIFMNFPIWNREGLDFGQKEKQKVQDQADAYLSEVDEELWKHDISDNAVLKAIHMHNAQSALDKYNNLPHETVEIIPDNEHIVKLQDDLLLATKGHIWAKDFGRKNSKPNLIGYATISSNLNKNRLRP